MPSFSSVTVNATGRSMSSTPRSRWDDGWKDSDGPTPNPSKLSPRPSTTPGGRQPPLLRVPLRAARGEGHREVAGALRVQLAAAGEDVEGAGGGGRG